VHDLGAFVVARLTTADHRLLFRELVGRHHYLGSAVPYGAHLRYLISATRPQRHVVACVQFSSAAWRMAPRDAWIGWDDATRIGRLPEVVNNSRFLILPWISAQNWRARSCRGSSGTWLPTGRRRTASRRCCWKRWSTRGVSMGRAIAPPTGSWWERPRDGDAMTGTGASCARPSA
jgi:hypothetical protein